MWKEASNHSNFLGLFFFFLNSLLVECQENDKRLIPNLFDSLNPKKTISKF